MKRKAVRRALHYQKLTSKRRFGVELEINNTVPRRLITDVIDDYSDRVIKIASWAQSRNNNYWHVKQDATCGLLGREWDKGWEVASFVGSGEEDVNHIGMVAQALHEVGCEVNENCGLHVHVEAADFDTHQMGILLGYYAKFETHLLDAVHDCRHNNPYCETFHSEFDYKERIQYWSPSQLWLRLRPKEHYPHNNPYRWRSVNLVNFSYGLVNSKWNRKTVEFRLPECSLIDYDVKNWIRLFVNFVDWVSTQKVMPYDINGTCLRSALSYMGLGHERDKFYILSRELFNTKTWFLRRLIRMNKDRWAGPLTMWEPTEILNEMWNPVRNFA